MKRFVFFLSVLALTLAGKLTASGQTQKQTFNICVLNTAGEPQVGMILKVNGFGKEYISDEQGVFSFEQDISKNYVRTANFYFPTDKTKPVKSLPLDEAAADTLLYIDRPEDLARFKQSGRTFSVQGKLLSYGKPVAGAEIQIQGTGRKATSNQMGEFTIDADYSHLIVIRANGMENRYLEIQPFLTHTDGPYTIMMRPKGSGRIYSTVEQMPEYPGGMKAFFNYIDRKLRPAQLAEETGVEGVTVIQFVVEKDGEVTLPSIVRPLDARLDTAALQAIETMPRWIAGKDNGVKVRCKYSVPIRFKKPAPAAPLSPEDSARMVLQAQREDSISKLPPRAVRTPLVSKSEIPLPELSTADSTRFKIPEQYLVKSDASVRPEPKKRNFIVRFFRWLFGKGND